MSSLETLESNIGSSIGLVGLKEWPVWSWR